MRHRPDSAIRSARHGLGEQPAIPQAVSPRTGAARDALLRELTDEHYLQPARLSPEGIDREAGYRCRARTAAIRGQFAVGRFRQVLLRGGGEQA
jgi:hypothetical protein